MIRHVIHVILSSSALAVTMCVAGCATPMNFAGPTTPDRETTPLALKSDRAKLATLSPNRFEVKCDGVQPVAVKQREATWCWAACAEMLNRYAGGSITQEEIVAAVKERVRRGANSESANQVEVWFALDPDLRTEQARRQAAWQGRQKPDTITVNARVNLVDLTPVLEMATSPSSDVIVQEISQAHPLVLGLKGGPWGTGHIVLIYGVEYSRDNTEGEPQYRNLSLVLERSKQDYAIRRLMVIDPQPDPGKSQLVELSAAQLVGHVDFAWGKDDAHKKGMSYLKVFEPTPEEYERNQTKK